jgi:hypothetical protein
MRLQVRGFGFVAAPEENIDLSKIAMGGGIVRRDCQDALEEGLGFWKTLLSRSDPAEKVNRQSVFRLSGHNFPKLLFGGLQFAAFDGFLDLT